MTTFDVADPAPSPLRWLVSDSLVLARRNLEHVRQLPETLLDVTLQPLMFVILFAYVFGGVIAIPDGSYREYLLGGVMVQSLAFGLTRPAGAIATDLREGVVDRFRSLPMSRSAYLLGQVLSELGSSSIAVAVLSLSGLIVGWRIHTDLLHALAGYGLILLFAFAMLWCGILLGLIVRTPDAAQGLSFMVVFPMTFLASPFVPLRGFSGVLRVVASWNPISSMAAAVRLLFGNPTGTPGDAAWPLRHPVASTMGWCGLILLVCVPLTILIFRRRTIG